MTASVFNSWDGRESHPVQQLPEAYIGGALMERAKAPIIAQVRSQAALTMRRALVDAASPYVDLFHVRVVGFALARMGYTYSYLSGQDKMRGVFMSLSLLALYGMASYLGIALSV